MSDSLKKVLTGAVIGALLVGFLWHATLRRGEPAPSAAAGGSGSGGGARPAVSVVTAPVRAERLALELEALGTARANESIEVTAKVSNLITAVKFAEGQYVTQGAVLVELDGAQARADLAIAEAALAESRSQYARSRELYTTRALSEAQLEQIEATLKANEARVAASRSRLGDTVIRAPFAGRVGLRRVSVGSLVNPGTVITTLDDTRTIKLDFTIPETFLAEVTPGLVVTASSVAYPEQIFTGKVASIDSRVDPSTRSVTVRALVPNPEGVLKPGMFLTVRLTRGERDALVIPEEAVVPEQGDVFVFVVKDGLAEKRLIHTGQRLVGSVQVTDGLAAGEVVVTEGTQKLRDGAEVRVVGATDAPQPEAAAAGARS
jgi:membrane fusion protein (multidrug efflux system)